MAWRIRQEHIADGDIIEPSEWRINMNEYASEFNGFLDNDNMYKSQIAAKYIAPLTFTKVHFEKPLIIYRFNHETSGWLNQDNNRETVGGSSLSYPKSFPDFDIDSEEDGLLICECALQVSWQTDTTHPDYQGDPIDVSTAGGGGRQWNLYGYYKKNTKVFKLKAAYILCAMFRITVNGLSVAETGPLGNERDAFPVYLCGAIPIESGLNKVRVEVQFVWYSPGNDRYIDAASFNPISTTSALTGHGESGPRRECEISDIELLATHRKR